MSDEIKMRRCVSLWLQEEIEEKSKKTREAERGIRREESRSTGVMRGIVAQDKKKSRKRGGGGIEPTTRLTTVSPQDN